MDTARHEATRPRPFDLAATPPVSLVCQEHAAILPLSTMSGEGAGG